ncbi:MAG: TraB/GumN family protein [Paracoccaceae bacterium]
MLRLVLPLLLSLLAVTADARCRSTDYRDHLSDAQRAQFERTVASIPFATGNHWIATKGNRRLHLIGTMHTGDRRMGPIMRRLRPVIANADAVLLEITAHQAQQSFDDFELFRKYMLLPRGQSLSKMMSPASWAALSRHLGRQGMDPRALDRLQPWYASELLDQSSCVSIRPQIRSRGLDDRIEQIARRSRVPIGSLETVGQSLDSLLAMPKRDHVRLMELELARQQSGNELYNALDDAYFEEAIGDILVMSRWSLYTDYNASRGELDRLYNNLTQALLNRRNRNWMPVILRTQGNNIVVAVGAAHLPGREGLLNLLKKRGYSLQRAQF